MPPLDIEKEAIAFIQDAGETVKEIVSIGPSKKGTVVIFINEAGEKLVARIGGSGTEIFEFVEQG